MGGEILEEGGGSDGGGSGGGVSNPVPTATPIPSSFWKGKGSEYSYSSGCASGTNIDPVTTVLRKFGGRNDIYNRIWNELDWHEETSTQHFRDNGVCVSGDIGLANNGSTKLCLPQVICAQERWHIRCNTLSSSDPNGGYWATCTPHWDSSDGSPVDICGHTVRPEYDGNENYSGSGFDAGRDKIWWELVHERGYWFMYVQYWDNRLQARQCNGEYTGSNGWVNHIAP